MAKLKKKVAIQNAKIGWTNFAGAPTEYKPEGGYHTFTIFLEDDIAHDLEDQGWNVKWREPKNNDGEIFATLEVALSYNPRYPMYDPEVFRLCGKRIEQLEKEDLGILDRDCRQNMVENVDLGIRSHEWSRPDGRHGVKAYLDFIYVTVEENPFADKYRRYMSSEDDDYKEEIPF